MGTSPQGHTYKVSVQPTLCDHPLMLSLRRLIAAVPSNLDQLHSPALHVVADIDVALGDRDALVTGKTS
jgi:hypothetical protein